MSGLTVEEILSAADRQPIEVPTPEWGGVVYILPMSGAERDNFERERLEYDQREDEGRDTLISFRAILAAAHLCDEGGERLEFSPAQMMKLGEKNGAVLDRIAAAAIAAAGMTEEEVEKLEGNSESGQSDDSGIG